MKIIFIRASRVKLFLIGLVGIIFLMVVAFSLYKFSFSAQPTLSQPIYSGSNSIKSVAITCNVDWGNEHIPAMLKVMKDEGITATFFITGRWADKYPELTKSIAGEGHTIGNHGYSHRDHSKLDYDGNLQEILKAQQALQQITGKSPVYFAPPSGAFNDYTIKAAEALGCKVILWSIDTIDWKRDGTDRIIKRVMNKLHSGGIILMHPTEQTVEALPVIINKIQERGYEILSLEKIVKSIENR
jgi:probable sporulation protein (polysaccharide deacetylase family)